MNKEDIKKGVLEIIDNSEGMLSFSITPIENHNDKAVTKLEIVFKDTYNKQMHTDWQCEAYAENIKKEDRPYKCGTCNGEFTEGRILSDQDRENGRVFCPFCDYGMKK